MSIFVTGDNHGDHTIRKLAHSNWKEGRELTRSDFVIIAGDFGLLFSNTPTPSDLYHLDWLNNKPWTTLVVDGNHENHPMLNALPRKQFCGGEVGIIRENILHLRRGQIFTLQGKKFFVFGGARSEDIAYRKEHISWWKEELPSFGEMQSGLDVIKANPEVDYIITHTAPNSIIEEYRRELGVSNPDPYNFTSYLQVIAETAKFKHWYFGHFHVDIRLNDRFTAVYHSIIKLEV